jgi:ATP-dependent DNA ligase
VQLYIFDILAANGEDLRALPLSLRKTNLARQLARRPDGIYRTGRRRRVASQS